MTCPEPGCGGKLRERDHYEPPKTVGVEFRKRECNRCGTGFSTREIVTGKAVPNLAQRTGVTNVTA